MDDVTRIRNWMCGVAALGGAVFGLARSAHSQEPMYEITDDPEPAAAPVRPFVPMGAKPINPAGPQYVSPRPRTFPAVAEPVSPALAQRQVTVQAEPTRYQEIEPGRSTLADIEKQWGAPVEGDLTATDGTLVFEKNGYQRVELSIANGTVQAIVLHLDKPTSPIDLVPRLDLKGLVPVVVYDNAGQALGQAYPERGVLFSFTTGGEAPKVGQIVLEPISGESFLLRAESDRQHRLEQSIADLEFVLQLEPNNAKALWLRAEKLAEAGRPADALASISAATRLSPETAVYRIAWARMLMVAGQYARAAEEAQRILARTDVPTEWRARAECLLGDIAQKGARPNFQEATAHHTNAIKLAAQVAGGESDVVRRIAKRVLLDAHLGTAHDIAWGNWQRKDEAVAKWLQKSAAFAEDLIETEGVDDTLRYEVACRSIEIFAGAPEYFDPTKALDAIVDASGKMLQTFPDPLFQSEIRVQLGTALARGARIEQARSKFDQAIRYAAMAAAEFDRTHATRQPTAAEVQEIGKLYFTAGSLAAQHKKDHGQAVAWFERARPLLTEALPDRTAADDARLGEMLVSMGISYWQTGRRKEGLQLTQQGAELIEEAVRAGRLPERHLAVPYGNMANMQKAMGNAQQAQQLQQRAARLEMETPKQRR